MNSMKNGLISIIVPVYKVEKYLCKCVDSILSQTYKNIEVILVDDGSPDLCGKICDSYLKKDNRVKVIHKSNGGLSSARNAGIEIAKGEYIGFVDADDYIDSRMYEILHSAITKESADMAVCELVMVDEFGKYIEEKKELHNDIITGNEKYNIMFLKWHFIVAWNKLYSRHIFDNLKYEVGKIHEDEFIIHKILGKCKRIVTVQDELYYYVQRNDSIMGQGREAISIKSCNYIEALYDRYYFLKKRNVDTDECVNIMSFYYAKVLTSIEISTDDEERYINKVKLMVKEVLRDSSNFFLSKNYFKVYFPKLAMKLINYRNKDKK